MVGSVDGGESAKQTLAASSFDEVHWMNCHKHTQHSLSSILHYCIGFISERTENVEIK